MLLDHPFQIFRDPFPHIVSCPAIPWSEYWELQRAFPNFHLPGERQNQRVDMQVQQAKRDIPDNPWVAFMEAQMPTLHERVCDLFGLEFPGAVGLRGIDEQTRYPNEVNLQAMLSVNTHVAYRSRNIGPHLDDAHEIWGGLFYVPETGDTQGGNFRLYKQHYPYKFYGKLKVPDEVVECVKEVPYEPNKLLLFLNLPASIHGTSEREPGPYLRRFACFGADYHTPLYRQ